MPGIDFGLLRERITMRDVLRLLAVRGDGAARGAVAWPVPGAWFPESPQSFVFGERAVRAIPMFRLRNAGARLGIVVGGTRNEPACRGHGVMPVIGPGDTMGDTLVAEGRR